MSVQARSYFQVCAFATLCIFNESAAFCPYLSSSSKGAAPAARSNRRALYDSISYYGDGPTRANNNCFVNDGGNLDAHHQASDGSAATTFDIMSELSASDGGSDMCVFSMQELRLSDNDIGAENLLELIYLGDSAGRRMHEFAQGNSDNVLLAACTVGRIGATKACSNAKQGIDGYSSYSIGDDDGLSGTPTYYKDRFCKSSLKKSKIDHPHAITIFRLNSNDVENAEALLEQFRDAHATNMAWAYDTQIGAGGHMLAKIVPCSQIPDRFKDPASMYPNLSNFNSVCDYVGSNGRQFAEEALLEWQNLCSVWPTNEDGSAPKCHNAAVPYSGAWKVAVVCGLVVAAVATVLMYRKTLPKLNELSTYKRRLVTESDSMT